MIQLEFTTDADRERYENVVAQVNTLAHYASSFDRPAMQLLHAMIGALLNIPPERGPARIVFNDDGLLVATVYLADGTQFSIDCNPDQQPVDQSAPMATHPTPARWQ